MTVSYTAAKVIYEGNGQTTQWDIPFPYLSESDVQLFLIHADGTETALTSDFTIDPDLHAVLYPMSGSQTPPLPAGEKLMILRRTALAQQTEFEAQQAFDPFLLEEGYDKAMMIAQEQAEEIARAIKFPASCTAAQTNAQSYLSQITSGVAAAQLSVQAAQTSASNAAQSAEDASDEADRSAWNADNAQQAQINAAVSYNQAKQFAESASSSAASALSKASEAQTAAAAAQTSLTSAQASAQAAAASAQEAQNAVQTHNTNAQAHSDIRTTLAGKAEQTALSVHTADTDNPHAVTKAQVGLGNVDNTSDADKPISTAAQAALDLKANSADVDADISDINAALERKEDDEEFYPADYGWPDIRPGTSSNSMVLLAGVKTDYSQYDNLGFVPTCEGGYNVFIDGVPYGQTYASGAQCSITWSQYSATSGFSVTQPQALSAHIVQIVPATAGNNITAFKCARVADTGTEEQGLLWVHMPQGINLPDSAFSYSSRLLNAILAAITTESGELKIYNGGIFQNTQGLVYVPVLDFSSFSGNLYLMFQNSGLKSVTLKNLQLSGAVASSAFEGCRNLKEAKFIGCSVRPSTVSYMFHNANGLIKLPQLDFSEAASFQNFLTQTTNLKAAILNFATAANMTALGAYGSATSAANGIKGVLVSAQAPFTGSSPQINVSYTGLDQAALAALFNSLPYNVGYTVVGSPTIQNGVASGFSSSNCLTLNGRNQIGTSFVLKGKFRTPSVFPSQNEYIRSYFADTSFGYSSGIYLNTENKLCWYIGRKVGMDGILFTYQSALSPNTDYWYKAEFVGGNFIFSISSDGTYYEEVARATNIFPDDLVFFRQTIGAQYFSQTNIQNPFSGSIYLNEFYEEFNGYPCFRGTAAMDKTINITGATGAASLTAEQLAIATNKGWTVTR